MAYIDDTTRINDLIVQVVADEDGSASNPRDDDNVTEIYGDHRSYKIGDGKPPSAHMALLERGGIRLLYRYLRLFGDPNTIVDGKFSKVLAFTKLGMIDHSGVSYYTVPVGSSATHPMDYGGWDSGCVGYVMVTEKRWRELMGDMDPKAEVDGEVNLPLGKVPVKQQHAYRVVEQEVEEYDDWARGNVWGYVIIKPCPDHGHADDSDEQVARCQHSEVVESVWGFIGDPKYVWSEAEASAKALSA